MLSVSCRAAARSLSCAGDSNCFDLHGIEWAKTVVFVFIGVSHCHCSSLQSHPTVGVARFGPKVSDQLTSLREELSVRMDFLLVYSF